MLQEKLKTITATLEAMSFEERKDTRLIETIKRQDWNGNELEPKKIKLRPLVKDGRLVVMTPHATKRGYYFELRSGTLDIELEKKNSKSDKERWTAGILNFIKRTEASGLWPDLNRKAKIALDIGYDKVQAAYKMDDMPKIEGESYTDTRKRRTQAVKAIDERLVGLHSGYKLADGKEYPAYEAIDCDILWHLAYIPKIKKMNFGKYGNEEKLAELAQAMREKKELHLTGRTSYDVSLEYKPEANKCWYSEEFRGCGNGHYYLALDATHAWHYEDD
jgi:hypothetical protein